MNQLKKTRLVRRGDKIVLTMFFQSSAGRLHQRSLEVSLEEFAKIGSEGVLRKGEEAFGIKVFED